MKLLKYILSACTGALLGVGACTPQPAGSYTVTGRIEGLPDGTRVRLVPVSHDVEQPLADTVVTDGTFVFRGIAEEPRAVYLTVAGSYGSALMMLESGKTKIKGKVTAAEREGTLAYDYSGVTVSGSPATDKYRRLLSVRDTLDALYQANNEKFRTIRADVARAHAAKDRRLLDSLQATEEHQASAAADREFFQQVEQTYRRVVMDNKDTYWGPLMMISLFSYLTADQLPWYEALSPEAQKSYYGQKVIHEITPPGKEGTAVPAFTVQDKNGNPVTLADLCRGKRYLLIDFWASWCRPCRKEIPNLKKLYAAYAAKGFDIVSISIDKKEKDWQKALKEEKLPWHNFRDTAGIADLYKVKFVPTMYLIDAQGIIVGDNLRGEALADKMAELFKQ